MKRFLIALLLTLNTSVAVAQTTPFSPDDIANGCGLPAVNCGSKLSAASMNIYNTQGTPAAVTTGVSIGIQAGFQEVYPLPAVVTPSTAYPTPVSVAGDLTAKYSIIASAGPTAMFVVLPQATGLPANTTSRGIFNLSANPVAIVPYPLDVINASAAATPFSCASAKFCECLKITATTGWGCTTQ